MPLTSLTARKDYCHQLRAIRKRKGRQINLGQGAEIRPNWFQIQTPWLPLRCVPYGKLLQFSEPHFPICRMRIQLRLSVIFTARTFI